MNRWRSRRRCAERWSITVGHGDHGFVQKGSVRLPGGRWRWDGDGWLVKGVHDMQPAAPLSRAFALPEVRAPCGIGDPGTSGSDHGLGAPRTFVLDMEVFAGYALASFFGPEAKAPGRVAALRDGIWRVVGLA